MDADPRTLLAAQGYCELSMFDEALGELTSLPAAAQKQAAAIEMRLVILMQARRWRDAVKAGTQLMQTAPEKDIGYIHTAFCLHEMGRSEEARAVLLGGPATLEDEPVFHYNLACYACVLGDLDAARSHLTRSIELDKKFRDFAKSDPDLQPLREDAA